MNAIILLVDRVHARIFELVDNKLKEELDFIEKDMPQRVKSASWAGLREAKVARHIEEHERAHYKTILHKLDLFMKVHPAEALLLGGPKEAVAAFNELLGAHYQDLRAGEWHTSLKIEHNAIETEARVLLALYQAKKEKAILAELASSLKKQGRGVTGVEAVIESLNLGEVQLLLTNPQLKVSGFRCQKDGYLASYNHSCARCGAGTSPQQDLLPFILEVARSEGGKVVFVHTQGALDPYEGIAAFLRFK